MTDISGKRVNVVEINEAAFEELTKTVPEEIIAKLVSLLTIFLSFNLFFYGCSITQYA